MNDLLNYCFMLPYYFLFILIVKFVEFSQQWLTKKSAIKISKTFFHILKE